MQNYVQDGDVLTLPAPYAVASGGGAQVGGIFGVAATDVASGAPGEFVVEGVFDITALASDTGAVGATWYWDNANKRLTATAGSNLKVGVGVLAKAAGVAIARVRLNAAFG